jgi:hypothetical protein
MNGRDLADCFTIRYVSRHPLTLLTARGAGFSLGNEGHLASLSGGLATGPSLALFSAWEREKVVWGA